MKTATLCFVLRQTPSPQILLGRKKRGFGMGKVNGFGGKPEDGETIRAAAVREVHEEAGIRLAEADLRAAGEIVFRFPFRPEFNHHVFVFVAESFTGTPVETDEMHPMWSAIDAIPYDEMWQDDAYWLPRVLDGEAIKAEFSFAEDNETVTDWKIDAAQASGIPVSGSSRG